MSKAVSSDIATAELCRSTKAELTEESKRLYQPSCFSPPVSILGQESPRHSAKKCV